MSDRDDILKAIGADIRTWTIGPGGVSADGDEDTRNLLRVLDTHPHLPETLARPQDAESEGRLQTMLDVIRLGAAQAPAAPGAPLDSRPGDPAVPNPLRMSDAIAQYEAAVTGEKLAERTVLERVRLLESLAAHVVAATPDPRADPFVHEIETHHLSTFLDSVSAKAATNGERTAQAASPLTLIKEVGILRRFSQWACEERQAAAVNPASGLGRRDKALRKAASRSREHYEPFDIGQLQRIFEPRRYLAFNNDADYFWAPLLGLHLGTRLKEICTLDLLDIERDEPTGIWYMDVTPENAKTTNSIRRLPIATRLVELGFID